MGSNPGFTTGQVPTAAQWNGYFTGKQDDLGFTPLNTAGGVMSGGIVTAPSTSLGAGLNIAPGIAPGSPLDGDVWRTTTGLFTDVGGLTFNLGGWNVMAAFAKSVNLNAAGDTQLNLVLPTTNYIIEGVWVRNTGTLGTLSTVKIGLFSLAGGSGINIFASGTAGNSLNSITSGSINVVNNSAVIVSNSTALNLTTVFLRVMTPQGGPAAVPADIYITVHPIP